MPKIRANLFSYAIYSKYDLYGKELRILCLRGERVRESERDIVESDSFLLLITDSQHTWKEKPSRTQ